jgi:hypothetical protein
MILIMKGLQDVADFWRREMSMRMQVSDILIYGFMLVIIYNI